MKVLPTKYNGYQFRSRTEARWAFFFDELYMPYEYEKEGFLLPSGECYLPDFYLPTIKAWVEIKGYATRDEELKCVSLSEETGDPVILIEGIPCPNTSQFTVYANGKTDGPQKCRYLSAFFSYLLARQPHEPSLERINLITELTKLDTVDYEYEGDEYAYGQAKSARFGDIA